MTTEARDREFVAASRKALGPSIGSDALRDLGWWELLGELDDPDARVAVFALFRAHGRELADTCALGALAAAPYVGGRSGNGTVVAAIPRWSARRGWLELVVGDPAADHILFDRPGHGAAIASASAVTMRRIDVPGRLTLHEVEVDARRLEPVLDDASASTARARRASLGRLAVAFEILGAAEGALALAVEHARGRVQFGQPIGAFQAVRHLLAWALTDCVALEALAAAARDLGADAPEQLDEVVKALAGRNGRRACERTLQVLGAIGFTTDLDHHHFHSRVLALDSIMGSSTELTARLGAALRERRADPEIARALLFALVDRHAGGTAGDEILSPRTSG
jgi:hypothetical protein